MYRFKFTVSPSQIDLTSSLMMSGPNSSNCSQLDYQVCEQCWSLITNCKQKPKQFASFKMQFSLPHRSNPLTTL